MEMRKVYFPTSEKHYSETLVSKEPLKIGDFVQRENNGQFSRFITGGEFVGVVMSLGVEYLDEKTGEIFPHSLVCVAREGELAFSLSSELAKKPYGTYLSPRSEGWKEALSSEKAFAIKRESLEQGESTENFTLIEMFRFPHVIPTEAKTSGKGGNR